MRVSCLPDDPGYLAYTGNIRIWFNGELQGTFGRGDGRLIVTADDEIGMIRFNVVHEGRLAIERREDGEHYAREFVAFGIVTIERVGRA